MSDLSTRRFLVSGLLGRQDPRRTVTFPFLQLIHALLIIERVIAVGEHVSAILDF